MISRLFDRVVHLNILGKIDGEMSIKIHKGFKSIWPYVPRLIAVSIDS